MTIIFFAKNRKDSAQFVADSAIIVVSSKEPDITSHFNKVPTSTVYANALNAALPKVGEAKSKH